MLGAQSTTTAEVVDPIRAYPSGTYKSVPLELVLKFWEVPKLYLTLMGLFDYEELIF